MEGNPEWSAEEGSAPTDPRSSRETPDALAALLRWEAVGGEWVVRSRSGASTIVDLISCDGGNVMGHLVSSSPDFVAYLLRGVEDDPDR